MKKRLFLHGFFATGSCPMATALKEAFEGTAIVLTPDRPLHPKETLREIRSIIAWLQTWRLRRWWTRWRRMCSTSSMRPENSWMSLEPSSWHGLRWQKVRTACSPTLPSPRLARNMARLLHKCLTLAVAERRNHHPENRSQGAHAGESESLRLQTWCWGHAEDCCARHRPQSLPRPSRWRNDQAVYGVESRGETYRIEETCSHRKFMAWHLQLTDYY